MRKILLLTPLTALLLAACNGNPTPQAAGPRHLNSQTLTAQSGSALRTYQADLVATTTFSTPGLPTQVSATPAGLKAAYLFTDFGVKTRMDVPGTAFPDQRARIATYDSQTGTARVLFTDTLATDPNIDPATITALLQTPIASTGGNGPMPMSAQSASAFRSDMQADGLQTTDGTSDGTPTVTATRSFATPNGGQQTTTLTFNSAIGMVDTAQTRLTNPEGTQNSTTAFTYDTVTNLPDVRIPTRIHTDAQLNATATGKTVTLAQDVTFQNPSINTLSDAYFTPGGAQ